LTISLTLRLSIRENTGAPRVWGILIVGLLVGAITNFGMDALKQVGGDPTIWLANGVLLAILLRSRSAMWPVYLLSSLIAGMAGVFLAGFPVAFALRLPAVNTMEVALSLTLLRQCLGTSYDLSEPRVLWHFALIATVLSPFLSAVLSALLFMFLSAGHLNEAVFIGVFFSHALGTIIITPVILSLQKQELSKLFTRRKLPAIASFGLLIGLTSVVFIQTRYPLLFLVYPPLVLVVCLFSLPGGAIGLFVMTIIAIYFTLHGDGPMTLIHSATGYERIIVLQLFAAVAAILVLVLSAILAERDRTKTQLETAKEELAQLAATDSLTGLANRRRLDEVLSLEHRRARRVQTSMSMLLLDVDYFKPFNDQYGHQAGDECLRKIAAVVAKFGRRPGDLVARYGGEELAILLSPTDAAFAEKTAEAIRAAVQALALPHAGNDASGVVTASVGVATYDANTLPDDPQALIAKADAMLYAAKRTGRNRVISWPGITPP
jgi:diguanylate cyclase (GGDEF)-like protein